MSQPESPNYFHPDELANGERPDRRTKVRGIALGKQSYIDSVIDIKRTPSRGYSISYSLPDIASYIQKGSQTEQILKNYSNHEDQQQFMPTTIMEAAGFKKDSENLGITIFMELNPDKDGTLQLEKIDIKQTNVFCINQFNPNKAEKIFQRTTRASRRSSKSRPHPILEPADELIDLLLDRRYNLGSFIHLRGENEAEMAKNSLKEGMKLWELLARELRILSGEAAARYCAANNIPTIYETRQRKQSAISVTNLMDEYDNAYDQEDILKMSLVISRFTGSLLDAQATTSLPDHKMFGAPFAKLLPFESYAAVVNLINIAAFKQGIVFPYSSTELMDIVEDLNEGELRRKNNLKQINLEKNRKRETLQVTPNALKNMHGGRIHDMIADAIKGGYFHEAENLQTEVSQRMIDNKISPQIVYQILFDLPIENGSSKKLRNHAMAALYVNNRYLDFVKQKLIDQRRWIKPEKFVTKIPSDKETVYLVNTRALVTGKTLESKRFRSTNEEAAINLAYANLISQTLGFTPDRDQELQQLAKSKLGVDTPEWTVAEMKNHLQELTELCKNNQWGTPIYNFDLILVPAQKTACTASVTIGTTVLSEVGYSNEINDQEKAKNAAIKRLSTQLRGPIRIGDTNHDWTEEIRVLCDARQSDQPRIVIEKTGDNKNPVINSIYFMNDLHGRKTYAIGSATTEKEASNIAAAKAYIMMSRP